MSKPLFGLLIGGILGIFDGLSALMYPETAPLITGIVIGSTVKGLVGGVLTGFILFKIRSMPLAILVGLLIGAFFAFLVAMQPTEGKYYFVEIMIPGSIMGAIVGFATQKYGRDRKTSAQA